MEGIHVMVLVRRIVSPSEGEAGRTVMVCGDNHIPQHTTRVTDFFETLSWCVKREGERSHYTLALKVREGHGRGIRYMGTMSNRNRGNPTYSGEAVGYGW